MPRPRKNKGLSLILSGLTLDHWQADGERLAWAQQTERFREVLSVLINERTRALSIPFPMTENRLLGRAEGYELALDVLRAMAQGPTMPTPSLEPTYEPRKEDPKVFVTD